MYLTRAKASARVTARRRIVAGGTIPFDEVQMPAVSIKCDIY